MCWSSHYSPKPGYKEKKNSSSLWFHFLPVYKVFFACGCCCNIKLKQFPGHYCSRAIATFQFLSWMCGKLQRLLRHQQKTNYVSESPVHHVSPRPGNLQQDAFVPEGAGRCAGSPNGHGGHFKKYSNTDLRELTIHCERSSSKTSFSFVIQRSKYPSWNSFLLKQANKVKRRQEGVLKASWLLFIMLFLHLWFLQFFSFICVFHPFSILGFPLFSNSTSLIIAIFLPFLIFNTFSILFRFPFCLRCHHLLALSPSNWVCT